MIIPAAPLHLGTIVFLLAAFPLLTLSPQGLSFPPETPVVADGAHAEHLDVRDYGLRDLLGEFPMIGSILVHKCSDRPTQ